MQVCSRAHTGEWKRRDVFLEVEHLPTLTFQAIIQLIQLTVLCLPLPENQVVRDVAVGVRGRLPLQDDLG